MAGVSCGANHTAAFTQTGELYCWGWGEHGRLGLGHEVRPLAMHGPHDYDEVVSRWRACTRGPNFCRVVQEMVSTPTLVEGALEGKAVIGVSCGSAHTVVLTADGVVYAFGWNEFGQVGGEAGISPGTPSSSGGITLTLMTCDDATGSSQARASGADPVVVVRQLAGPCAAPSPRAGGRLAHQQQHDGQRRRRPGRRRRPLPHRR